MINEDLVEQAALEILREQGFAYYLGAEVIAPDGSAPERSANGEVLLIRRPEEAITRLNPSIPLEARSDVLRQITGAQTQNLIEENRRIHGLLVNDVDVEFSSSDGTIKDDKVWLVDWEITKANDGLVAKQLTVIGGKHMQRPEMVEQLCDVNLQGPDCLTCTPA